MLPFDPSARAAQSGMFVLVNAGAELDRYMAGVTWTFVVGEPSAFQRDLYQLVLAAQERAIARGVTASGWKSIHLACAIDLLAGLVARTVMRARPNRSWSTSARCWSMRDPLMQSRLPSQLNA